MRLRTLETLAVRLLISAVLVPFLVQRINIFWTAWSSAAVAYADMQQYVVDNECAAAVGGMRGIGAGLGASNGHGVRMRSAKALHDCMDAQAQLATWPVWHAATACATNLFGLGEYTFHLLFLWESLTGKLLILAVVLLVGSKAYGGAHSFAEWRQQYKLRQQAKQWQRANEQRALNEIVQQRVSAVADEAERRRRALPPPPVSAAEAAQQQQQQLYYQQQQHAFSAPQLRIDHLSTTPQYSDGGGSDGGVYQRRVAQVAVYD